MFIGARGHDQRVLLLRLARNAQNHKQQTVNIMLQTMLLQLTQCLEAIRHAIFDNTTV